MSDRPDCCEWEECWKHQRERLHREVTQQMLLALAESVLDIAGDLNMEAKVDEIRRLVDKVRSM